MKSAARAFILAGTAFAAVACGDAVQTQLGEVPTTLTLSRAANSSLLGGLVLMDSDSGPRHPGLIRPAMIDSLIATVRGVALHPRMGVRDTTFPEDPDSVVGTPANPFRPGVDGFGRHGPGGPRGHGGPHGPFGLFGDSVAPPPPWILLSVVSGGEIDLMNLPTEEQDGMVLATGDAPAGEYHGVRLIIGDGTIWLNTDIVTPSGDTLHAGTGIPVLFPHRGIMVKVDFTVPETGGEVPLVFDEDTTIGNALVRGDGVVFVTPVMRHRHGR
jgi:hypothetical protein